MKITDIKTYLIGVAQPELVILEIFTDEGFTGLGECTFAAPGIGIGTGIIGVINWIKPYVIGQDPFNIEHVWHKIFFETFWARTGGIHITACMSAIEIAMWDIIGKKLGVPIYNLLGGHVRDKIKLYHSNWYWGCKILKDYEKASCKAVEDGFSALKIDPFDFGFAPQVMYKIDNEISFSSMDKAIEILRCIRDAVGDSIDIILEGHGRFSPNVAIRFGKKIEKFDLLFYEEPIPPGDVDSMLKIKNNVNIPIAAGERVYTRYGFKEYLEKGALDIIQPDPCFAGGILEVSKKIASMADVYSVQVSPHLCCGPIATAVAIQIDACMPNFLIQEFRPNPLSSFYKDLVEESFEDKYWTLKDGYIDIPKKPGLGITLRKSIVKKHLYIKKH